MAPEKSLTSHGVEGALEEVLRTPGAVLQLGVDPQDTLRLPHKSREQRVVSKARKIARASCFFKK